MHRLSRKLVALATLLALLVPALPAAAHSVPSHYNCWDRHGIGSLVSAGGGGAAYAHSAVQAGATVYVNHYYRTSYGAPWYFIHGSNFTFYC
jgi:hypothetical protein